MVLFLMYVYFQYVKSLNSEVPQLVELQVMFLKDP